MKILVADDHPIIRDGLKLFLTHSLDLQVSEARDGYEAIEHVQNHSVDLVILDLSMPGLSGLDTLKQIKQLRPSLPVLALSMFSEEQYALRVLRSGAAGYVCKDADSSELLRAINKVAAGGRYISSGLAAKLVSEMSEEVRQAPHTRLSDREFQILCMIASGKPVSKIAMELHLSVNTISTYRRRILEKMALKNNSEITQYVIKNQLIVA